MCITAQKRPAGSSKLGGWSCFASEFTPRRVILRRGEASVSQIMRILLYNPDNGVTRNFMPHLWMFLLQSLTPAEHEVLLIDGNARPMDERQLVNFIIEKKIGLVGIGSMTIMIARAYRISHAILLTHPLPTRPIFFS